MFPQEVLDFYIGRLSKGYHTHSFYFNQTLVPHSVIIKDLEEDFLHVNVVLNLHCIAHYYGSQCNTYCMSRNDATHGYYTCGVNGEMECMEGWSDPNLNCSKRK